jgi:hypothetical protein
MEHNDYTEKRNKRGILVQIINIMALLSLLTIMIIAALLLLPQRFDNHYNQLLRQFGATWGKPFLCYLFYLLLLLQVIISVTGLLMNSYRLKRKDDKYRYSLIIYALVSLIVIAFYLVLV